MIPLGVLASAGDSPPYIDEKFDVPGQLTYFTSPVAGTVPATGGQYLPSKEGGVLLVPSSKGVPIRFTSPLPLLTVGRKVRVQVDLLYPYNNPSSIVFAYSTGGRVEVRFTPSTTQHALLVSGPSIFSDSFPATNVPASWYPYPNITLGADFEVLSGSQMRIDVDLNGDVVLANMVRSLSTTPVSGDNIGLNFDASLTYAQPAYDNFKVWIS